MTEKFLLLEAMFALQNDRRMAKSATPLTALQISKNIFWATTHVLLLLMGYLQFRSHYFFQDQQKKATVINYAGRQSMISQKLTKLSLQMRDTTQNQQEIKQELKALDANWSQMQQALRHGNEELGILLVQNATIDSLFHRIQPHKDSMSIAVASLSRQSISPEEFQAGLQTLQRHEGAFLSNMDQLVKHYELDAQQNVEAMKTLELTAGFTLIFLFVFIFRTSTSLLVKQNRENEEALKQKESLNEELLSYQAELKRTREFLEQTNQVALVGGWEVSLARNYVHWTDITRQIHEVDDDFVPVVEKGISFFKEGKSRETISRLFQQAVNEGKSYDVELQIITATGKEKWVRAIGIPEFKDGQCIRVFGTFQDIDLQKANEANLRLMESVVQNVKDSIVVTEAEPIGIPGPKIVYVNPAFCTMTGYSQEEIIGKNPRELQGPETSRQELDKIKESLKNWEPFNAELINYKKNGDKFWVNLSVVPVADEDGWFTHWIAVQRDVTERRENEQKLLEAKAQAESASQAKSEFLANMSHEIRTPLNGVIGFSDLLMKTNVDEHQNQYLQAIHTSGNALLDLINDILDFSKIESGKMELAYEKTDLWEMLEQVASIVKFKTNEKDIELLIDMDQVLPRYAETDPIRLRQILINLLGNAVKFTETGEIELSVKCINQQDTAGNQALQFAVRDTGIGISPERQASIFSAFAQEDMSTTRKYGGTGLGLSISNQLLKMMGTQLEMESTAGVGSKFFFTLHLKTEEGGEPEISEIPIRSALIVDDNHKNCQIIQGMLSFSDIDADVVHNGIEALQKVQTKQYDVLIIDYCMPYMNGLEAIRQVRSEIGIDSQRLPILLLYSSSDDIEINRSRKKLGIQHVMSKPITLNQLNESLKKIHVPIIRADKAILENREVSISDQALSILLVDDNPMNRKLAINMLQRILPQAHVTEASDGQEAVSAFEKQGADIILMDLQMPNMSGYQASEKIRTLFGGNDTIIIALTAGTVKGEKEKCLRVGMDDYLSKPIVIKTLEDKLQKYVKRLEKTVNPTAFADSPNDHFDLAQCKVNLHIQDCETLKDFVYILFEQLNEDMPRLHEACRHRDVETLRKISHKHKSSTASLSMVILSHLFRSLEGIQHIDHQDIQDVDELVQQIAQEVAQLRAVVAQQLDISLPHIDETPKPSTS